MTQFVTESMVKMRTKSESIRSMTVYENQTQKSLAGQLMGEGYVA